MKTRASVAASPSAVMCSSIRSARPRKTGIASPRWANARAARAPARGVSRAPSAHWTPRTGPPGARSSDAGGPFPRREGAEVGDYIHQFYNPVRLHSANGHRGPVQREEMFRALNG